MNSELVRFYLTSVLESFYRLPNRYKRKMKKERLRKKDKEGKMKKKPTFLDEEELANREHELSLLIVALGVETLEESLRFW